MNTPMPPNEPLDATERELARILRALPAGGAEPPAALDAAILRAASNAAASARRPGAKLLASAGALWGIGSAAAAVLALGVFWQMKYGGPAREPAAASAPAAQAVSDREEEDSVAVDLGEVRPAAPAAAPPALEQQPAPAPAALSRPPARAAMRAAPVAAPSPPPPPPAPEAYPADHLDEHVARDAALGAAEAQAQAAAGAAANAAQEQRADTRERESLAAKSAAAPSPAAAPRQEPAQLKPANWIEEIRRLRDVGKLDEARAKLVEFRRAYPNWVIPTDLAPLLSE